MLGTRYTTRLDRRRRLRREYLTDLETVAQNVFDAADLGREKVLKMATVRGVFAGPQSVRFRPIEDLFKATADPPRSLRLGEPERVFGFAASHSHCLSLLLSNPLTRMRGEAAARWGGQRCRPNENEAKKARRHIETAAFSCAVA